jgi:hypothetical protein
MSKRIRGLALGAMLAVLGSATAAVAAPPPGHLQSVGRDQAVQRFRAGERASFGQATTAGDAIERFRAGERAVSGRLAMSELAAQQTLAAQRSAYYQSTHQPTAAPATPGDPGGQNDTPVALLAVLGAAAALSLSLDALFVRRKARKATAAI